MASQAFTFFQTGNLTPDPPTSITTSILGTSWTNSWVNAITGRAPAGLKITTYATATPGTAIQTTNLALSMLYTFTTVTFNTGGATGRNGPILSAAKTGLTGTPAPSTWYDSYLAMSTPGYQLWTVPVTGSYTIRCAGAGTTNGLGIIIETTVNLTKSQQIQIVCGQQGIRNSTGSSGGSGGSFVASGSTPATGVVLVAAGGGGGTELQTLSGGVANATTNTSGNAANTGAAGGVGGAGGSQDGTYTGGGGGFTGNGASGSNNAGSGGLSFTNGSTGGTTNTSAFGGFGGGGGTHGNTGGGGGGGGYSGGGGSSQTSVGLGGGGGSYPAGATNIGTNSVAGYVIITFASPATSIPTITYASPAYAYGTQYGISVQTSNIQGKLSPGVTGVAIWLAQPTLTVTMTGTTLVVVGSSTGATGYTYNVTATPATNPAIVTNTTGTFTCSVLVQYVANVYATAVNSQSIVSANSASVWCLTQPVITAARQTNNIYSTGTRIVGTTFTIVWTAGDANASGYSILLNGTGTANTTTTALSTTFAVSIDTTYYATVTATALNSTSSIVSTVTLSCLASPLISTSASSTYISGLTFYIAWSSVLRASSYTLYIGGVFNSLIGPTPPATVPPTSTSVTVTAGSSYYATVYATATSCTSTISAASLTIYCLATPTITAGSPYTDISGTTFKTTWSAVANVSLTNSYLIQLWYYYVPNTTNTVWQEAYTTSLTYSWGVFPSSDFKFYTKVYALATNSTSVVSTASSSIWCLSSPSFSWGDTATNISGNVFNIVWTSITNAINYKYIIYRSGILYLTSTISETSVLVNNIARGYSYYVTVYAAAANSKSLPTTSDTLTCITLTFTVSMSVTTFTASVVATPSGYGYSYSLLSLYDNSTLTSYTGSYSASSFTALNASITQGHDYYVSASATYSYSSSGSISSTSVPCILITYTLSINGTTLTPSTAITPSPTKYTYTLSSYTLITNGTDTATTSTTTFTVVAGNYYAVKASATATNSSSGVQASSSLYCLAAPIITVTLTSTSLTSSAVSTNPSGITLTYTYTLYTGVPGSGSAVGNPNTSGSFTISGTSYYIIVYSSYSSTGLSTTSATTQTIQPLFGTISFTATTSLSVTGSCIGATTLTFTLFSSSSETGTFTQVGTAYTVPGTSTTKVFTSLAPGTVYNVRLSATNDTSTTSILSSNYWCINVPTSFSITSMSLTTVNFSWTEPSGANSYTLTYGSNTQTLTGSSGSLTISSLTNNTNYLCSLKATNTSYYSSGINSSSSGTLYFAFIKVSGTTVSYNWVAPATLTYTIRIAGAAGQNAPNGNAGGRGGILTVSKSITTSTSVTVRIGTGGGGTINQSGGSNSNADGWGGVPGGGTGYGRSSGGGGGYTQFDTCIAGAGGGGGGCAYSADGSTGGVGGGSTGGTGGVGSLPSPNLRTIGGGAGGTQSNGGAGGTVINPSGSFDGNQAANGSNGSSLLGGNGGNSNGGDGNGGGGGGGYYGGGGGAGFQIPYSDKHTGGGGGGGSSYYPNTYTIITNGQGTGPSAASGNMGIGDNGYVLINT